MPKEMQDIRLNLATFGLAAVGAATGSYLRNNSDSDKQNTRSTPRAST